MRPRTFLRLMLLGTTACLADEPLGPLTGGPWIRVAGEWAQAPREVIREQSAPATILRFKPNGEFVMLHCIVGRTAPGTEIGVRLGDGLAAYAGRWRSEGAQRLAVEYTKIEETFPAVGAPKEQGSKAALGEVQDGVLRLGESLDEYHQDALLPSSYVDGLLDAIIANHRAQLRTTP